MSQRLVLTTLCLLLGGALQAAVPVVGLHARHSVGSEGGSRNSVSFYYTNSALSADSWSKPEDWAKMVSIKIKVSGTAKLKSDFQRTSLFEGNLKTGIHTSFPRWWKTLYIRDDAAVEGTETFTITILPDPSYTIDPAHATVTLTIRDNDVVANG